MCGIVAVLQRRSAHAAPGRAPLDRAVRAALDALAPAGPVEPERLRRAASDLEIVDRALRGVPGVGALLADPPWMIELDERLADLHARLDEIERRLDHGEAAPRDVESVNAALVTVRDVAWAVRHDRLRTARAVADLLDGHPSRAALETYTAVQLALSSLDRLEVRGRDSAGLHLVVADHSLDLGDETIARLVAERAVDPLFRSRSVRVSGRNLAFVYKAAAEIGELGDNTAALRAAIRDDELLRLALANDGARAVVLGHTRWASVGIISEANAHPLDHEEVVDDGDHADGAPYVAAALNGDVDNHGDLRVLDDLRIRAEITTDAKVIPVLVSRRMARGETFADAFRATAASLEGSVAVAAVAGTDPDRLALAQRGSGQALYVGLADDAFVVASEPYGLVEITSRYVRLDGETPADPENPEATRGQVVVLDAARAGELTGIERHAYDGTRLPLAVDEVHTAAITTRDIDRGDAPHYLLKEIREAPQSFRKTLRSKLVEDGGRLRVVLSDETLPADIRERLGSGSFRRLVVIGQGTAAVAGKSVAAAVRRALDGGERLAVDALPATELSGFGLRDDMRDTLIVAISQSGTTTDTNRTVDLARSRGAAVIAIVNRRNSDLVEKADGVLYTSDGRDVEMSVASTKAFYAQVAAGFLLGIALADELALADGDGRQQMLAALRGLPDAMDRVLGIQPAIAAAAQRLAPARRSWATVGNGVNRIAAEELRIKLSELCYKSIACDATEDKKHIDLSAEPLVLVCATGLSGSIADDVAKEVAIYRAHKAAPVVIADEGSTRFAAALELLEVPATHPALAFVLAAMAGHLFGYEAALAIDSSARPLREARAAIEVATRASGDAERALDRLRGALRSPAARFFDTLRAGDYDGSLDAGTAVGVSGLLRYALGVAPLDVYEVEFGKVGTPSTIIEDLTVQLTRAIEELTRPIDAIKHQAKTVTVGISRSDEALLQVPLVQELFAAGAARDGVSYRSLRTLVALDRAVERVVGYTRYRIDGAVGADGASIHVVDRGGVAATIPSRTDADPRLRGTKHRAAFEREVTVARGRADGRTVIIVPEVKEQNCVGLVLLHVVFANHLPAATMRSVLQGYRGRYAALKDAVTETEPAFRDELLGEIGVVDLLFDPVYVLAERWRSR